MTTESVNAEATLGLSWDATTLYDAGGNTAPLADMLSDLQDGSLQAMIEEWRSGETVYDGGERESDWVALCDAIHAAKGTE
jgi:hypothetical protein